MNMAPRRDIGQHPRELFACILHRVRSFRLAWRGPIGHT
jgi:hypothetical protein